MLSVEAALEAVARIDLEPINQLLKHENPAFWTEEVVAETEANYRRLLALNLLYPSEELVVNKILDDYWHQHILDTRKYAEDCQKVFGFYLHHDPYFGVNGKEDRQRNREAFAVTQQLWEEAFGSPMVNQSNLTLDKILGAYDPSPNDSAGGAGGGPSKDRVYAFPKTCKCGQHCSRKIVPDTRINPQINPAINPQINPQILPAILPEIAPGVRSPQRKRPS